ncbi:MAG: FAD-binding protein [Clostridia bacterium]
MPLQKCCQQPCVWVRLARHYGIPSTPFLETVAAFNDELSAAATGPDAARLFNRSLPADALKIAAPPYYAMRMWPKVHYIMGGLQIDTSARVMDLEHRPIPGLYAAGEITGGIHGASRLGSCAITDCLVYGRMAGKTVCTDNA